MIKITDETENRIKTCMMQMDIIKLLKIQEANLGCKSGSECVFACFQICLDLNYTYTLYNTKCILQLSVIGYIYTFFSRMLVSWFQFVSCRIKLLLLFIFVHSLRPLCFVLVLILFLCWEWIEFLLFATKNVLLYTLYHYSILVSIVSF